MTIGKQLILLNDEIMENGIIEFKIQSKKYITKSSILYREGKK